MGLLIPPPLPPRNPHHRPPRPPPPAPAPHALHPNPPLQFLPQPLGLPHRQRGPRRRLVRPVRAAGPAPATRAAGKAEYSRRGARDGGWVGRGELRGGRVGVYAWEQGSG